MVKGRRARQVNTTSQILNDTASPKRKDCKYDTTSTPAETMVLRGGRSKANGITQYLTSCSAVKPVDAMATSVIANSVPKMDNFIDLTDENTCDSYDNPGNNSSTNSTESPLVALGFNVIKSNPASNIFLQEPVLSLNFDKTPTNQSRIVIKNSFLATEIHSKFSPPKCDPMWGSAAASITIKREPTEYALDLSKPTQVTEIDSTTFLNQDSNSCDSGDSGVVIMPSGILEQIGANAVEGEDGNKRRKPATPHRILCPSPVKNPIVASPSTALAHLNIQNKRAARKNAKSKRRLHTKELENALEETVSECSVSTLQNVEMMPVAGSSPTMTKKHDKPDKVLNNAVNPTPQQNTNNNECSASTGALKTTDRKLTDFFQVRRSVRKTKKEVQWERDRDLEKAIREQREEGLKVVEFDTKGRGVVTTRPFGKGEFVVEYIGDLITVAEAKQREQIYAEDESTGCYMYYFKHKNIQHCIDATAESGRYGRLVNHSRNGNLMTKTVSLNNRPHLVLLAKEDIAEGVEITYDYGDRSKEALQHHPWLAF